MTFGIGDIVRLRSAHLQLTVYALGDPVSKTDERPMVKCRWFNKDDVLQFAQFDPDTLILVLKRPLTAAEKTLLGGVGMGDKNNDPSPF